MAIVVNRDFAFSRILSLSLQLMGILLTDWALKTRETLNMDSNIVTCRPIVE
jgi:hypothetical protein